MKNHTKSLLLGVVCLALSACSSDSGDDSDDTGNSDFASAASEVGDAAGAGATAGGRSLFETAHEMLRGSCSALDFTACDTATKTRTRSFSADGGDTDPCTRGSSNGRRVFGKSILTFSDASCLFDSGAAGVSVARTLSNHYIQRGNNGKKLVIYTGAGTVAGKTIGEAELKDYEGTTRSGGVTVTRGTGSTDTMTISGIHRRGLTNPGRFTMWHTLWTEANGISVVRAGTGADRTATLSGTMYIMHNRAQKKVTKTLADVKFVAGCAHPVSGTATLSIPNDSGTPTAVAITYTSSCGTASLDGISNSLDPES